MSIQYALFVSIISIFSLLLIAGDLFFVTDPELVSVIQYADLGICFIFFLDFLYALYSVDNKTKYFFTWGWLDLISSIPAIDLLRTAKLVRIYQLLRVIRGLKAAKVVAHTLAEQRITNVVLVVTLFVTLVMSISSVAILIFENVSGANIKTAEDAIWWSYVTITTVGYGDRYPITTEGRILGAILMTLGIGLFGIVSGFIASWFLKPMDDDIIDINDVHRDLAEVKLLLKELVDKN
ncbi:MAG: potassium channel family protein [Nitrososphaeraceae archaeon]